MFALTLKGPKIWNNIPTNLRQLSSLVQFRKEWSKYINSNKPVQE